MNSQEFDSRSGYSAVYPSSWAVFVFLIQPALKIVLPVTTLSQSLSSILSPSLTFAIPRARAGLDSGNCEQCKYEVYWQNTTTNSDKLEMLLRVVVWIFVGKNHHYVHPKCCRYTLTMTFHMKYISTRWSWWEYSRKQLALDVLFPVLPAAFPSEIWALALDPTLTPTPPVPAEQSWVTCYGYLYLSIKLQCNISH